MQARLLPEYHIPGYLFHSSIFHSTVVPIYMTKRGPTG
jgi:hypothetical protein